MEKNQIIEKSRKIKSEMKKQVSTYILAGFGFVASLAWNETIKAFIEKFFPVTSGNDIFAKFFYALFITGLVVLVSYLLLRSDKDDKE